MNSAPAHPDTSMTKAAASPRQAGFTLIEMLLVIVIISILAGMTLPSLRGFSKSNSMTAATRLLLDDMAYARQKAMADRTPVYMVFISDNFLVDYPNLGVTNGTAYTKLKDESPDKRQINTLTNAQLRGYALMALRTVGDQPGCNHPRYLTPWHTLPDGVFIPQWKFTNDLWFVDAAVSTTYYVRQFDFANIFPFPAADSANYFYLPFIKFLPSGQLVVPNPVVGPAGNQVTYENFVPLTRGSVQCIGDPTQYKSLFITETPPGESINNYTMIHLDPLSGKARLVRKEIQ